ncbi:glutamate--tRNA ligase [Candidatus Izemoplasma sp. B36]|uniref:glutamate--tRNA ligase n=1 Tax=Candidatus Izemoplasma sp. B36 TaxID=3242468 RepID=UPI003557ADE5
MNNKEKIANLIFPNVNETISDLENRYPKRNLDNDAIVTRFAPSPTGFLHTGSLFASLVSQRFAKQTNGVFFLRLEDTDQKREIEGSGQMVVKQLESFSVIPDESFITGGNYGPYVQSERKGIYHIVIKEMIENDLAYPCFCTHDELNEIRKYQEENKLLPGYYKEFAKCRKLTDEEVIHKIENGESYVIRFKSNGDPEKRVDLFDAIRGHIQFPENIQDIVIMKSDKLPTYHFAHAVDDHFMRTTHITRGEEWMSSVPIHLELFDALGFEKPIYCHLPVIMKLDDGKRRKLSKRKDAEASVEYFLERGYPIEGFLEYLMTLANSNFEEWRIQNPDEDIFNFKLSFEKMSLDGALFDVEKIKSISKVRLAHMSAKEFTQNALNYAKKYDKKLEEIIEFDYDYFMSIINIERDQPKPRKDYEKYSDVLPIIGFMYDDLYSELINEGVTFNERFEKELLISILEEYKLKNGLTLNQEEWFGNLKEMAINRGFAARGKDFKKNPDKFIGTVGDYAEILRLATCGKKNTPNFYSILTILGSQRVNERIDNTIKQLKG